ncbi:MAG: 50S ribosomal protein L23 [Patescibacteria group bacterium]
MALFGKSKEKKPAADDVTAVTKTAAVAPQSTSRAATSRAYAVLIKPLISEKASLLHATNKYSFMVAPRATKNEVKKAVQAVYGVKPLAVNMIVGRGKAVRSGRWMGQRKNWKKAIVTLPAGDSIKVFEGI